MGLNESTWLKMPVPSDLVEWVSNDSGANVRLLTSEEWIGMMEVGLERIASRVHSVEVRSEGREIIQRYGLGGIVRILFRVFSLYRYSAEYRESVKHAKSGGVIPKNLHEYFGYGIYVGRKWEMAPGSSSLTKQLRPCHRWADESSQQQWCFLD